MFKKIISSVFVMLMILFSVSTVVSCTTTSISTGLQRLFYKNAKIASFAASAAILNDKSEAEATSSSSLLGGGAIGQQYVMNKYGQMTVDSALGKEFLINQNEKTVMSELFESTFGSTDYTYTKKTREASDDQIVSNDTSGYITGSTALDGINGQLETILDALTIGISPTTISTLINVIFEENVQVDGLSLSRIFKVIEGKDEEIQIDLDKIMKEFILDYVPDNKGDLSIKSAMDELKTKVDAEDSTVDLLVQFVKMNLKTAYNYFDEYLNKNYSLGYEKYISNTNWTGGIADDVIDFSKLTNLFKYVASTDENLSKQKEEAKNSLATMSLYLNKFIGGALEEILSALKITNDLPKGTGEIFVSSLSDLINYLLIYLKDHEDKSFNNVIDKGLKNLVKNIGPIIQNLDEKFYQEKIRPILESIDLSSLGDYENLVKNSMKTAKELGSLLITLGGFLWNMAASKPIKKLLKPLLENIVIDNILNFKFLSILGDEKGLLSEVGNNSSFMPILAGFRNLSIENIAKFFADSFKPIQKNITFDLKNISELINRVRNTGILVDGSSDFQSMSDFVAWAPEEPKYKTVEFRDRTNNKKLFEYNELTMPAENARYHMAFGVDKAGANVYEGSIGETIVKIMGVESGELLYSISKMIQDIMISKPTEGYNYLDEKYLKPLYKRSNWTMDEFNKFKKSLPYDVDEKNPEFTFNLYRDVPDTGETKTYKVTIRQGDDSYWKITNITR